jgi:hypothetical protein
MGRIPTLTVCIAALLALGSAAQAAATVTVCNEDSAMIHVALANQLNGSYTTAGWWAIPLNACQDINFTLRSQTIYFTADSDGYVDNGKTVVRHWGAGVRLFVGADTGRQFSYANADKSRGGAKAEAFQADSMADPLAQLIGLKIHITKTGSSVEFTTHP